MKDVTTLLRVRRACARLIIITQDFARPDRGAIEISTQPLQDALRGIPTPR